MAATATAPASALTGLPSLDAADAGGHLHGRNRGVNCYTAVEMIRLRWGCTGKEQSLLVASFNVSEAGWVE